jgi:hypothetical protein
MKWKYIIIIIGIAFLVIGGLMIYKNDKTTSLIQIPKENANSFSLYAGEFIGTKIINGTSIIIRTGNTETKGNLTTNNYITTFYPINKFRDNGTGDYVPTEDTFNLSISKTGEIKITDLVTNKICYIIMNYSKVNPMSVTNPTITIRKEIGYWYFETDAKEEVNSMGYTLNCKDYEVKYEEYKLKIGDYHIDFKEALIKQNISTTYNSKTSTLSFTIEDGKTGSLSKIDPVVTYTTTPAGGNWTVPAGVNSVQVLVVAGGGGGGGSYSNTIYPYQAGGGGGGGGLIYNSSYPVTPGTNVTNIAVGTGGAGGVAADSVSKGTNGVNSTFGTITARGGGGGGGAGSTRNSDTRQGLNGGSGGGEGIQNSDGTSTGGTGNPGGNGGSSAYDAGAGNKAAGGGGGMGANGQDASVSNGGDGGIGVAYSISGSSVYYGGGGGGACGDSGGTGGTGGGGAGGTSNAGTSGTDGYGGGGGGGGGSYVDDRAGGDGGDGVVIINYTVETTPPNVTIIYPTNTTYSTASINFNISANDTFGISSCWMTLDNGVTNKTMSNTSIYWNYTNSSIPNGSYRVRFYCNDTTGNINNTEYKDFTIAVLPIITLNSPENDYNSPTNEVIFNATANITAIGSALANMSLWHNASGTWQLNQSILAPYLYDKVTSEITDAHEQSLGYSFGDGNLLVGLWFFANKNVNLTKIRLEGFPPSQNYCELGNESEILQTSNPSGGYSEFSYVLTAGEKYYVACKGTTEWDINALGCGGEFTGIINKTNINFSEGYIGNETADCGGRINTFSSIVHIKEIITEDVISGVYKPNITTSGSGIRWGIQACDSRGYCNFSVNRTLNIILLNCWTENNNIISIPNGCVYNVNNGGLG